MSVRTPINPLEEKAAQLQYLWKQNPVLGIRQLFGVEPDQQQIELIQKAFAPESRIAVKSCQGAGKTSTLVWLTYLMLLTLDDCRIMITSPSYQQLSRVFHSEANKWKSRMIYPFNDFFNVTKETISLKKVPEQMASLVTANADNEESLQGGHADNYVILADEASGLDDGVFDILLGTLGTGTGRFIMTSNPIRNSGIFYRIFDKKLPAWERITFSAEGSSQVKKSWIKEMGDFYGTDSDIYKIRVLAQFPRIGESQFIPTDIVEAAMEHDLSRGEYFNFEKVCGVDIARFGSDSTVFTLRQGPKLLDITVYNGLDTMEVSSRLIDYQKKWMPSRIFVDSMGVGAGVYDRCAQLGLPVVEVIVSAKSSDPKTHYQLRGQLWEEMRSWLANGADVPNNADLKAQLCAMTYGYNNKMQIQLTSKKDLKRQGLPSPDIADSLSLTFAGHTYAYRPKMAYKRNVVKSNYLYV